MDDLAVKESRSVLRLVHEHVRQKHLRLGALEESAGMVDVVYHPASAFPTLNYVTPRRGTAWVSGSYLEHGLQRLRALGRGPRAQYVANLFPPPFGEALARLGLKASREIALMVYRTDGLAGRVPPRPAPVQLPEGVRARMVTARRGAALWRKAAESGMFDIAWSGLEPIALDQPDDPPIQRDLIAYRHRAAVGLLRLSVEPASGTAHLLALGAKRETGAAGLRRALATLALRSARRQGCGIIFAGATTPDERDLYHGLGFVELGQFVACAVADEPRTEGLLDAPLGQPVLAVP